MDLIFSITLKVRLNKVLLSLHINKQPLTKEIYFLARINTTQTCMTTLQQKKGGDS